MLCDALPLSHTRFALCFNFIGFSIAFLKVFLLLFIFMILKSLGFAAKLEAWKESGRDKRSLQNSRSYSVSANWNLILKKMKRS